MVSATDFSEQAATLSRYMATHLPLAMAMRITVETWDGRQLCLVAPLASNCNDKGTAFGGSLVTLATYLNMLIIMEVNRYLHC